MEARKLYIYVNNNERRILRTSSFEKKEKEKLIVPLRYSNPNTETCLINGGNKFGPRTIHPR